MLLPSSLRRRRRVDARTHAHDRRWIDGVAVRCDGAATAYGGAGGGGNGGSGDDDGGDTVARAFARSFLTQKCCLFLLLLRGVKSV